MKDTLLQQFPSFKHPNTLVYLGSSMYPTLKELDIIEYAPYQGTSPKRGDIIVIQRHKESEKIIIHRVIKVSPDGIRTQGDNSCFLDLWTLQHSEILGYITNVRRKKRIFRIHRGYFGYLGFLNKRAIARVFIIFRTIANRHFQRFAALKLPARLLSRFLMSRMLIYYRPNRSETQLFLGSRYIGYLQKGKDTWEIKPPYRFIIDPDLVPIPKRGVELDFKECEDLEGEGHS